MAKDRTIAVGQGCSGSSWFGPCHIVDTLKGEHLKELFRNTDQKVLNERVHRGLKERAEQ